MDHDPHPAPHPGLAQVKRLLDLIAMTAGGWLGWALGAPASLFLAYILSVVGAGFGLYAARRFMSGLIP